MAKWNMLYRSIHLLASDMPSKKKMDRNCHHVNGYSSSRGQLRFQPLLGQVVLVLDVERLSGTQNGKNIIFRLRRPTQVIVRNERSSLPCWTASRSSLNPRWTRTPSGSLCCTLWIQCTVSMFWGHSTYSVHLTSWAQVSYLGTWRCSELIH